MKYERNLSNYRATTQNNITNHTKLVNEGWKYYCNKCDSTFTRPNSLTTHIKSVHEGVKYDCNHVTIKLLHKVTLLLM